MHAEDDEVEEHSKLAGKRGDNLFENVKKPYWRSDIQTSASLACFAAAFVSSGILISIGAESLKARLAARTPRRSLDATSGLLDNPYARDTPAGTVFDALRARRVRIATMDLRIAAIAISRGLIVLTRNVADFGHVPGLQTEDWTV